VSVFVCVLYIQCVCGCLVDESFVCVLMLLLCFCVVAVAVFGFCLCFVLWLVHTFSSVGGCSLWCLRLLLILLGCFCCGVCGCFAVRYVVFVAALFCYIFCWGTGSVVLVGLEFVLLCGVNGYVFWMLSVLCGGLVVVWVCNGWLLCFCCWFGYPLFVVLFISFVFVVVLTVVCCFGVYRFILGLRRRRVCAFVYVGSLWVGIFCVML